MRNKKLANIILIILLISFIIITLFRIFISDSFIVKLISFTIEAALVGGIADWFAVTALFRKPLGFSWHTAIIPKNKEKVIATIANVVEVELLSTETIKNKVEQLNIIDRLIPYIEKSKTKINLVKLIGKYSERLFNKQDTSKIASYMEEVLKNRLRNTDLSVHISNLLDWFIKKDIYDSILEVLLNELISIAKKDSTRDAIYNILNSEVRGSINSTAGFKRVFLEVSFGLAEGTNSINISEAAASMQKELIEILLDIKNRENDLYLRLKRIFEDSAQRLKNDTLLPSSIEAWKQDIIEQVHLQHEIKQLIDKAKSNMVNNPTIVQWIIEQLDKYWNNFKQDDRRKNWINNTIKEMLYKIIKSEHYLIGRIVKDTLNAFTGEALNEFIEAKAGNDLHWIRINGSIVGAVTGLILFLFINLFYDPVIVPIIRSWVSNMI